MNKDNWSETVRRLSRARSAWEAGIVGPAKREDCALSVAKPPMDLTWLTTRIAVGGGIWRPETMADVAQAGVTHIVNMQIEFDDTKMAEAHGIEVLWNAIDDDFQRKPPEVFRRGVDFALGALEKPESKLFIHCAAGVHRAPMMALALLCFMGWNFEAAVAWIEKKRPVADFPEVYLDSVRDFLKQ